MTLNRKGDVNLVLVAQSNYPSLEKALSLNTNLKGIIEESFTDNEMYLKHLDELFRKLFDHGSIGILEKMKDVNDLMKLKSTIAEFYIGRIFVDQGFSITFLDDGYSDKRSPDIKIEKNGLKMLVEVMRIGDGPVLDILLEELRIFLKGKKYRVDLKLDEHLSLPPIGYVEIQRVEAVVNDSINEFKNKFSESTNDYIINTRHIKYHVQPIFREDGYPGIITHETIGVPTEKIISHICHYAKKKAEKRCDFNAIDKSTPYLIAFLSELSYLDGILFQETMYGTVTGYAIQDHYMKWVQRDYDEQVQIFKSSPEWKRIEYASKKGWNDFLSSVHLIPTDFRFISKHGLYLSDKSMDHVTGILLTTNLNRVTVFPNPFADENMDNLKTMMMVKNLWINPF